LHPTQGEELAHLTHAYVVVFAARSVAVHTNLNWHVNPCHRPESIGEGNRRLYLSDEFKDADPDLAARINKVTQELNDIAVELARRAGWEVQSRKKRRSDDSKKSPEVPEQARSTPCTSSTSISSTQNQTLTQRPNHTAIPNPAENSSPVPTKETALVTTPPMSKLLGMDRNKIESFVRALMYVFRSGFYALTNLDTANCRLTKIILTFSTTLLNPKLVPEPLKMPKPSRSSSTFWTRTFH